MRRPGEARLLEQQAGGAAVQAAQDVAQQRPQRRAVARARPAAGHAQQRRLGRRHRRARARTRARTRAAALGGRSAAACVEGTQRRQQLAARGDVRRRGERASLKVRRLHMHMHMSGVGVSALPRCDGATREAALVTAAWRTTSG